MFEKLLKRFFWIPLVLGFAGYMLAGESDVWHGIYAAAALYFVNPVNDTDNALILIAKLLAIVVTTGVVLSLLSSVAVAMRRFFVRLGSGATVVYGDCDEAIQLEESLHRGYRVAEPKSPENVSSHILCFSEDLDTIRFYQSNKDSFKGQVYMIMHSIEPYLLSDTAGSRIHVLSLPDLLARHFFHEHEMYDSVAKKYEPQRIALIGYGNIGSALFRTAYR